MTLSDILDNVLLESGMDTETAYASSSKDEVLRLVKLANRSAGRIATSYPWQAMRKTHLFSLTTDTTYALPTDFRALIPDTGFADSYTNPMDMRTNPSEWRYYQVNSSGSGPNYKLRILGDLIHVYQPISDDQLSFEYLCNTPVLDTDGITYQQRFDADTDTFLLDDDLLTMDLIWRYKKLLGLPDWQVDQAEFKSYERVMQGQEAGAKTIRGEQGVQFGEPHTNLWVDNA